MSAMDVQNKKIDVDTKVEQVIEWDSKGAMLSFEIGKGRFLELKPEVVAKLGTENRIRYQTAQQYASQVEGDEVDNEIARLIRDTPSFVTAGDRMRIQNPDPNMEYATTGLDGIEAMMARGYSVVQGGIRTGQNPTGKGVTKFMSNGKVDLVLMQIPKAKHEELIARNHEGIQNFMDGQTAQAKALMEGRTAGSLEADDYNPMK